LSVMIFDGKNCGSVTKLRCWWEVTWSHATRILAKIDCGYYEIKSIREKDVSTKVWYIL